MEIDERETVARPCVVEGCRGTVLTSVAEHRPGVVVATRSCTVCGKVTSETLRDEAPPAPAE